MYIDELPEKLRESISFPSAPIPFNKEELPEFPIDCLPPVIGDYVTALAANTQTSLEMAGVLVLGVLATVMQGKYKVKIGADYAEQLSLYTVAVAEPGERKSSVIKALVAPIIEYESKFNKEFATEIAKSKIEKRILEKHLKQAEDKIVRNGFDEDTKAELETATKALIEFKGFEQLRLLVSDITPEKLIDVLDRQNGILSISSAEGNLFDLLANKNDRGTTLIDPILKGYSGDRISVDRLTRAGNVIDNPHISMIMTVQPHVLNTVIKNNEFNGKGLVARFLFAKCGSFIGERDVTSPDIPDVVKTQYRDLIFKLLDLKTEHTFALSPEAEELRQDIYGKVEKRLDNKWYYMREFGSKFIGTVMRIAGLIHGAENYDTKFERAFISYYTLDGAIEIAECLAKHAEQIYLETGVDETVENAKYMLKRIGMVSREVAIAKRNLSGLCQRFKKIEEMEKPLAMLVEHGYIQCLKEESGQKGRPKEWIVVNPEWKPP